MTVDDDQTVLNIHSVETKLCIFSHLHEISNLYQPNGTIILKISRLRMSWKQMNFEDAISSTEIFQILPEM